MSKLLQEIADINNLENVKSVQFGLLNPELLKKGSVCEVVLPETYDGTEPKENGLFDSRMGVIERGRVCPTDEYDSTITPGYFGHIDLAVPVYWIQHVDTIIKLLRCVCLRCSNLLIDKSNPYIMKNIKKRHGATRFKYIVELCSKVSNKKCSFNCGCNAIQPSTYRKLMSDKIKTGDNIIQIEAEYKQEVLKDNTKKVKFMLTPEHVYNILKRITNIDSDILGFNHKYSRPDWMICTVLPVAPPSVRPSVRQDNNQRAEDDLTSKIAEIVKHNRSLKKAIEKESDQKVINVMSGLLQYHVATMVDNEIANCPQAANRGGRPLKVIRQRLKGKEGRLRMNIMGKRVDYSARTVISVDPNISIDEYGVPEKIAMTITIPETVTKFNKHKLYKYVKNGLHVHPGAKQITKMNYNEEGKPYPETISLKYVDRESIVLEYGDIVERHLIDGDIALFNRQPTLHKMSMMGHKVKVMKGLTFRLNVFVCKPYNADFDGDEMNMHVPQNLETQYELENIAAVPYQIISPATAMPIIYVVQDTLSAVFLFTQRNNRITRKDLYNLMITNPDFNGVIPDSGEDGMWSGQEILSLIMPDISTKFNNNSYESNPIDENKIIIKNGIVKSGVFDKKVVGSGSNSLVNTIFKTYGPRATKTFLNNLQRTITRWFTGHGFSLGVGDTIPDKKISEKITELIKEHIKEANTVIKSANNGTYNPNLDEAFLFESLDQDVTGILEKVKYESHNLIKKSLTLDNRFNICVTSGAKGATSNIGQVMALVGQQMIEGSRVPFGFNRRTLPCFSKDDYGATSKGFVSNAYINGLEPEEFFFHQMGGRTGLIDTAIKTAESGYIQRRLIKALEDVSTKYDNTVRNSVNNIIQFSYGDDSIDATKLEKSKLTILEMNDNDLMKKYLIAEDDMTIIEKIMSDDAIKKLKEDNNLFENLRKDYERIYNYREKCRHDYFKNMTIMDTTVIYPVNFHRSIIGALDKFNIKKSNKTDLLPSYINEKIEGLLNSLKKYVPKFSLIMFEIGLYTYFSPKVSIFDNRLTKNAFDFLIESYNDRYISSLVQPGELVGIVAAQSIGEPLTQLTLNTFHNAGVGANSIITTQGVPRMKEIINVSKNIKTPSLKIYLKDQYSGSIEKAKLVKTQLEHTRIEDIVSQTQILYESNGGETSLSEDQEFINTYMDFADIVGFNQCTDKLSNWVLRIIFDKDAMMNKNIYLSDIQDVIMKNNNLDNDIQCIFTDDNAGDLIMRINIRDDNIEDNYLFFFQELEKIIMEIDIRGVENIEKVVPTLEKKIQYLEDGSFNQIDEWILNTDGVNLIDTIINEYVDETKTITNDIHEIYEIFGIEAARELLIQELNSQLQSQDVAIRHMSMLIDLMTYKGSIMPIERHGINRSVDTGPLAKATFEESTEILVKASTFAEVDNMTGVSSNVMMAQYPKIGTNSFDVLFDESKFIKNLSQINNDNNVNIDEKFTVGDLEEEINSKFKNSEFDLMNDKFNFGIDITKQEEETIHIHNFVDKGFNIVKNKTNKKSIKIAKNK